MHECPGELYGNFVVKQKSFCTSHSNICTSLALRQFSDVFQTMIGRNRAKLRPLTTTEMLYVNTRKTPRKLISYMKYLGNSNQNRWAQCLISDPLSKGTRPIIDPMIRFQITQISDPMNPCLELIR